jgi:hypothetical protein
MRVYIVNDTSSYHAGSSAVMASLRHKLSGQGHTVIHTTPRRVEPQRQWIERCDALVVNGEGAMQEEAKGWANQRATKIMESLRLAKDLGKQAYLVNSVWHRMNPGWTEVLRCLDGLWVREPISQRQMESEQGVRPDVFLDLSYSCPVCPTAGSKRFAGKDVIGTIYERNMPGFGRFSRFNRHFWRMKHLGLGGTAENKTRPGDWSYIVNSLSGADVYITGQHHGVYAACRARVPFAFFKVYNHKIQGLFEWAGLDIPIATTLPELLDAVRWAKAHQEVFTELFDWMDRQPVWPGLNAHSPSSPASRA